MGQTAKLDFKGVEAETDEILIACFTPTGDYRKVSALGSAIVLGQKGSGKTAILRKLVADTVRERTVVDLSPDEYLWKEILSYHDEAGEGPFASMHAWQLHVLYGIVLKFLIDNGDVEGIRKAKEFFSSRGLKLPSTGSIDMETCRRTANAISCDLFRTLKGISRETIEELDRIVRNLLSEKQDVLVVIDRLDVFWDNSAGANNASLGLLHAWKELSERLPSLSLKLSMRSDMYRVLKFPEHDKIQTKIVELRWTADRLKTLLARRISFCLSGVTIDSHEVLEPVFPAVVTGVRGYGGTQDTFSFILRLVHDRPRDLLLFCSLIKDQVDPTADSFPDSAIVRAEQLFSDQKRIGMEKEYGFELPGISAILQALSRARDRIGYDALEKRLTPVCKQLGLSFRDLTSKLLEFGVLGVYVEGEESYYYRDPTILSQIDFRSTTFVIHRSLRHTLGIVEYRGRLDFETVRARHRTLVELRFKVNEACKKLGMSEIFKPTSETEVIASAPKIATDEDSFGAFIDDMYMFIYESAGGSSLRIPTEFLRPESVVFDIKHLRTDLRHDTEHGKESDILQKEKRIGEAYMRHLGKTLPQDERDWLRLQVGIYEALERLMGDLLRHLETKSGAPYGDTR